MNQTPYEKQLMLEHIAIVSIITRFLSMKHKTPINNFEINYVYQKYNSSYRSWNFWYVWKNVHVLMSM